MYVNNFSTKLEKMSSSYFCTSSLSMNFIRRLMLLNQRIGTHQSEKSVICFSDVLLETTITLLEYLQSLGKNKQQKKQVKKFIM